MHTMHLRDTILHNLHRFYFPLTLNQYMIHILHQVWCVRRKCTYQICIQVTQYTDVYHEYLQNIVLSIPECHLNILYCIAMCGISGVCSMSLQNMGINND